MEMMDSESFEGVIKGLKALSKKRDPRSVRLAAVTFAILDVSGDDISPAKVYASAVTTLEASLQKSDDILSSLATQVALLELLGLSIPHVAPSTLIATLPMASRVLRGLVTSCQSIINDDDTRDELGGINATLRAACKTSSQLLLHIAGTPDNVIRQLVQGTLLVLWEDHRPKVRKAAQQGAGEVLTAGKNMAVVSVLTDFILAQLDSSTSTSVLHALHWLQHTILCLNMNKIGTKVMELLVSIMEPSNNAHEFVAGVNKRQAQERVLTINGIMSLLVAMMEDDNQNKQEARLDEFASRALATLLQGKPSLVFHGRNSVDQGVLDTGKSVYGQALLSTCHRVLQSNPSVGQKLYPLVVQRVVQLAKPDDVSGSTSVGEAVMPELTKLFRTHPPHSGEYILTSMEVVLQPVYRPTWSVSLLPLAVILQSSPNADVISQLLRLQTLMPQPIQEAVGSIIQGVGLEEFWNYVSWNDDKKQGVISPQQAWILPLLKSSGTVSAIRPNMAFFQGRVLGVARQCDAYATTNPSPANKSRVVDIWSLLTCCCCSGASQDFAKEFPALAPILVRAMGDERYPQLVTVICGALQILVQSIQLSEDENDHRVLSETSTKLLPALFKLVETLKGTSTAPSSKNADSIDEMEDGESESKNATPEDQRVQSVISAIAELARVAPKPFLQGLLKKVLQRLLAVTQSDNTESNKICTLLGLCQALISALDEASVEWVYRAVKPLIRSDEHPARVQKRAYKVMLEICQKHNDFVVDDNHWKELTELLVGSIMTCQVSARHMRLKCMAMIVTGFDASNKQQMDIIPKVVGEVLLCLKDSNGKTREAAYQLLLSLSVAMSDMTKYFTVIAAALGAETPHMRSAAVMAMSRLVFEYAREDDVVHGMLPMMLQTVLVLFDENSREVVKSVIGFVRVSVAAMTKDQLEPLLPSVTDGLLKYHRGKGRFRAKIKIIIKKLVRIYGYDKLMPLVPESDTRLLTHMRKLSERAARRKAAQHPEGKGESNDFEQMMESDEDDSDDGRTLMTGATRFTELTGRSSKSVRSATAARSEMKNVRSKAASTIASSRTLSEGPRLKDDRDGEVLDMLDPSMSKSVRFAIDEESDDDSDGGIMEFDDLGRLIVRDDLGENKAHVAHREEEVEGEDDENLEIRGVKKRKLTKFESAKIARDEAQKKRNKKTVQALGAAYKSKKSGGDVKKKGQKFEPYAFVPLDAKSYTKKNRRKAVDSMATVVRTGGKRKRN